MGVLSYAVYGAVLAAAAYIYVTFFYKPKPQSIPKGKFSDKLNQSKAEQQAAAYYDVAIVGAGPSGSTMAHYLVKGGVNVAVLEKAKFPRDKYCGDAVCKTAIEILRDMGIYQDLLDQNKAKIADAGGLVSPSGISYVGKSLEELGNDIPAAMAVKRLDLDEAIAMRARKTGANLLELHNVQAAKFDTQSGLWTITCSTNDAKEVIIKSRVMVCADGAGSGLATKLGIVTTPPDGVCSRQFLEGKTHKFGADGVVFYNKEMLPGYAALFKHPNDQVNFCTYLIPGNPNVKNEDCAKWHEFLEHKDPVVKGYLGPDHRWTEPVRVAGLRLGGVPVSYMDHGLLIGDAAGFIDPMTGEGIHHAMDSGRLAAKVVLEAFAAGNYSRFDIWQQHWMHEFGFDFRWSMKMCQLTYKYPIILDAAAAAVVRKGNSFLTKWAEIMTGRIPKVHLLAPQFVVVIGFELTRLLIKRYILRKPLGPFDQQPDKFGKSE